MLEQRLASFHEAKEAVVFSCAFWGLVLTIRCLALPGKSEVAMPSLTYRRMADVVAWAGLIPVFCEVDPDSLAVTPETLRSVLTDETALLLAAQPIVNCVDATGIEELSREVGVPLIIDSVESTYETSKGRRIGTFGDAELFSLHASKLINGMEGGYVTTGDPDLAHRLRLLRGFAFDGQDNVTELGLNAKLNEIHAAMALAGLDELPMQIAHNRSIYERYRSLIGEVEGLRLLHFDETEQCSFKVVVVELEESWPLSRDDTVALLNAEGILSRAYYSPPLHARKTAYEQRAARLAVTEELAEKYMLLPCGYMTSLADIEDVVGICRFLARNAHEIAGRLG